MIMDRKTIRKAFKDIGYSVSFKRNPFNANLCNLAFKTADMVKPHVTASSNVYSADSYNKHKSAFDLVNKFRGEFLEDTDQKIC